LAVSMLDNSDRALCAISSNSSTGIPIIMIDAIFFAPYRSIE
jgi:hypothetical protein